MTKMFGAFLFVGIGVSAYGCSSSNSAASVPADAGTGIDTGTLDQDAGDGGACKSTQSATDYDKCFTFSTQSSPLAKPVTTTCLPDALAGERPTGRDFGELAPGDWVLTQAYDLTSDCANPKTLVELVRYGIPFVNITTEYSARADGAIGKTTSQYVRLPPSPPPATDAGGADGGVAGDGGADGGGPGSSDAGSPAPVPPQLLTLPERSCPPAWPQVSCVDIKAWFDIGFFTATATELRLYKNLPGTTDGGVPDPSTAKLYAVYTKTQ